MVANHGAAMSGKGENRVLEKVPLRTGLAARRNVEQKHRHEIAPALYVRDRSVHAEARPWPRIEPQQVEAKILVNRDAFPLDPVEIRIDHKLSGRHHRFGHGLLLQPVSLMPAGGRQDAGSYT